MAHVLHSLTHHVVRGWSMTGQTGALPVTSILEQLRPTPRIFTFQGVLLGGAVATGAREVARWQYLQSEFASPWSVGITAAISAAMIAVVSLTIGRFLDSHNPRPVLVIGLAVGMASSFVMAFAMAIGDVSVWIVMLTALLEGAALGLVFPAILKTQASLVQYGSEGAAELLNILRMGVGGVIGAVVAGASPNTVITLWMCGVISGLVGIAVWVVMANVKPRTIPIDLHAENESVFDYIRANRLIRNLTLADFVLAIIIPTQLVNLVLTELNASALASLSIACGLAGVLIGRIVLVLLGFRGRPRVMILATTLGLAVSQVASAVGLIDGWMLSRALVVGLLIGLGSICGVFSQGILAALLQQEVTEEYRGRVGAVLTSGRYALIALGALLGALIAGLVGGQVLLMLLATSLIVVALATRGYRFLSFQE